MERTEANQEAFGLRSAGVGEDNLIGPTVRRMDRMSNLSRLGSGRNAARDIGTNDEPPTLQLLQGPREGRAVAGASSVAIAA